MAGCNIDDILCEVRALESMRALKEALGSELFAKEWPELGDLDGKLRDKIEASTISLKESLAQCGKVVEADVALNIEADVETDVEPDD